MTPTTLSLPELVTGESRPGALAFEEVARISRNGKSFRVDASGDQFRLLVELQGSGVLAGRTAKDWQALLKLLIEFEADLLFIRLCIAFLSTWTKTARLGAAKEI